MKSDDYLREYIEPFKEVLSRALDSLEGKQRNGLDEGYKVFCAVQINRSSAGFLCLKKNGLNYPARMLIRPAMEAMIKILAVKQEPSLLYRIARSEHEQDEKWARPFAPLGQNGHDATFNQKWEKFKSDYQKAFPTHSLTDSSIDLRSLAMKAKVDSYYDSHYRLYCQYTHAALRPLVDDLDNFSDEDERTIAATLFVAIEAVHECGGDCEGFDQLRTRFLSHNGIDEQGEAKNP